jgi:glycosyltransferase involved in cell wall biosynthesis
MAAPFVSIVTVTFNAAAHLVPTIESVLAQTHRPLEYVIVDGGSTDGTVDIIKRYEKHLARWVSEPDRGIYDAMNQSLGLVQGEWVNFMNAGDVFASPESVAGALVGLPAGAEVVYGSYDLAYRTFHKHKPAPADLSGLVWGMAVNHQSVFVRTGVARAHPFDLGYPLAADFGQLLGLYRAGAKFHRADQTVAKVGRPQGRVPAPVPGRGPAAVPRGGRPARALRARHRPGRAGGQAPAALARVVVRGAYVG